MKNLKEYITINSPDRIAKNNWFFNEIVEYYGNNIPDNYIKLYENCNLLDFTYLNENLQTHDYKKLQNKLLEEYGDNIETFQDYEGSDNIKSFYIILKNQKSKYNLETSKFDNPLLSIKNISKNTKEVEKFFSLLDFFNYRYSNWERIDNKYALYIEPIYSEDASDYFNKCHRQAYHFTFKDNVDKILKTGLRIKSGKYREFPNRIYLWAPENNKLDKDKVLDFIKKIFYINNISLNNVGIIKVDLYNTNYPIYRDTAMKDKEALFVYNNIPANLCKEILKYNDEYSNQTY